MSVSELAEDLRDVLLWYRVSAAQKSWYSRRVAEIRFLG